MQGGRFVARKRGSSPDQNALHVVRIVVGFIHDLLFFPRGGVDGILRIAGVPEGSRPFSAAVHLRAVYPPAVGSDVLYKRIEIHGSPLKTEIELLLFFNRIKDNSTH